MAELTPDPEDFGGQLSAPVPLTAEHQTAGFDCGVPVLNDWLMRRAFRNESRFSRSYVVCADKRVVAYYCISAGSIERAAAPGRVRRNAPDTVPISIIGRLAVDLRYSGRGLGATILADALRRIAVASQSVGMGAVLVQAKDESARRFYMACAEFLEYPEESRTLFLPIETIIAAFG